MIIGIPKEVKNHEYRVGATPAMVFALVNAGHKVLVEKGAGARIGFSDSQYAASGASLCDSAFNAEMIIKVKEPQPSEYSKLLSGQILFTFLHLAPDWEQTKALLEKKVIGIAYETVTDCHGRLPLLTPMSEVAGRVSIQAGANALQMAHGGRGVLLGGLPGIAPGKVVIIGGGVVGINAARMAMGLGAYVSILDRSLERLRYLEEVFGPRLTTLYSHSETIDEEVAKADLVISCVLIPGKAAPKLLTRTSVQNMQKGSVIVDVAIDQGGSVETSRPTTHTDPTYVEEGVVHYCVTNMPAAVARSSTMALTNATMPFALHLANKGVDALKENPHLLAGLNVYCGQVTNKNVALDLGYDFIPPADVV